MHVITLWRQQDCKLTLQEAYLCILTYRGDAFILKHSKRPLFDVAETGCGIAGPRHSAMGGLVGPEPLDWRGFSACQRSPWQAGLIQAVLSVADAVTGRSVH